VKPGSATPQQVLTAVQVERVLMVKHRIGCRNRICRDTGTYPAELRARRLIQR